ncbi:MAG: DUF1761 domain-containing protein [Bacteroidia bacterium]
MDINWLALAVAAASSLLVGFVWYHPKVFGSAWMKTAGMTPEKAQQGNMIVTMGLTLLFAFMVATVVMAIIFTGEEHQDPQFHTFKHGAFHGVIFGIFAALPILGINAMFEQKSWKYIAINVGYWVVTFALMGGIISAWR